MSLTTPCRCLSPSYTHCVLLTQRCFSSLPVETSGRVAGIIDWIFQIWYLQINTDILSLFFAPLGDMLILLLLHIWPGKLTRRTLISSLWIWANRCEIWVGCHFEMKHCSIGRYIQKMIMCQATFRTACKWKMQVSSISPFWCIRQKPYYDSVDKNAQRATVAHWSLSGAQPNAMTCRSHIIISANVLLMQLWKCR